MLLNRFGVQERRITKLHFFNSQRRAFHLEELDVALSSRAANGLMLKRDLQAVRADQFFDSLRRLVHGAAPFWQSSVKKGKLLANGIFELGIGEPRNVVKIGGNSPGFFDMIRDDDSHASLKVVAHFGEEP